MKLNRWCKPYKYMTAKTLSEAKTECSESPRCGDMFFDSAGKGNRFFACDNSASDIYIQESGIGSILYHKYGNNVHTQV